MKFDVPCSLCETLITRESQEAADPGGIISCAVMSGPNTFWYGLSGDFEFDENIGLKDGDQICGKCLKKHKFHELLNVECSICHKKYQGDGGGHGRQGWGCSGDFHRSPDLYGGKTYIHCGWGSRYDMTVFVYKDDTQHPVGNLICDECVGKLIADEAVNIDNSHWDELDAKALARNIDPASLAVPIPITNLTELVKQGDAGTVENDLPEEIKNEAPARKPSELGDDENNSSKIV